MDTYNRAAQLYCKATDRDHLMAMAALAQLRRNADDHAAADVLHQEIIDRGGNIEELSKVAKFRREFGVYTDVDYRVETLVAAREGDTEAVLAQAARLLRVRHWSDDDTNAWHAAADALGYRGLNRLFEVPVWEHDLAGAEVVAKTAADRGYTNLLNGLVDVRIEAGLDDSEDLHRYAIDCGDLGALHVMAAREALALRKKGDLDPSAGRIRRFGLTDGGNPAASLQW